MQMRVLVLVLVLMLVVMHLLAQERSTRSHPSRTRTVQKPIVQLPSQQVRLVCRGEQDEYSIDRIPVKDLLV